jgi:hypothetical protein
MMDSIKLKISETGFSLVTAIEQEKATNEELVL